MDRPDSPSGAAELSRRFQNGEESAFNEAVKSFQHRLLRSAAAILGDETEAADIVQETFVKAYLKSGTFRGDSELYTWLYRIMYNLCVSNIRRRKIIPFNSLDRDEETLDIPGTDPNPYELSRRSEIKTAVTKALQSLPERQRSVFVMKQFDGLKHGEIAELLGLTEGAVKASYFHAVKKLQVLLQAYGGPDEM